MEKVKRLNLDQLKLLAHPWRQRILTAFAGGEQLSVGPGGTSRCQQFQ